MSTAENARADARRRLEAMLAEEHVRDTIASWPPVTDEEADRIAALLVEGGAGS